MRCGKNPLGAAYLSELTQTLPGSWAGGIEAAESL